MITGLRNRYKKGFTLVEVMLMLVVLSLIVASSYSLITRKHKLVPRKSVHGQYACFIDPNDALDENGVTKYREIQMSGNTVIKNGYVSNCSYTFPKSATYVFLQMIGGGGAGGNARYNAGSNEAIALGPDAHHVGVKNTPFGRAISLVEPDWEYLDYTNLRHSLAIPRYNNGDPASNGGTGGSSGRNMLYDVQSWGGTTGLARDGKNIMTEYPRLEAKRINTTGYGLFPDDTDTSGTLKGYKVGLQHEVRDDYNPPSNCSSSANKDKGACRFRKAGARRGISRQYVDEHFYFHSKEDQVTPDENGKFPRKNGVFTRNIETTLFKSDLFLFLVRNFIVDNVFALDKGGTGPTAPGFGFKYFLSSNDTETGRAWSCMNAPDSASVSFADCLLYHSTVKKNLVNSSSCILPGINTAKNYTTYSKADQEKIKADINNNQAYYAEHCPAIYAYWQNDMRNTAHECFGSQGGAGTIFTSAAYQYSFGFTPVLGWRWDPDIFTDTDRNKCTAAGDYPNFYCYYRYGYAPCMIPNGVDEFGNKLEKVLYDFEYDNPSIDFKCSETQGEVITVSFALQYDNDTEVFPWGQVIAGNVSPDSLFKDSKRGTFTPCTSGSCASLGGVSYEKLPDSEIPAKMAGYQPVPKFATLPQLHRVVKFPPYELIGYPTMKPYHYLDGGYPRGFRVDSGYEIGVGVLGEQNNETGSGEKGYLYEIEPVATACVARGVMAVTNRHNGFDPQYHPWKAKTIPNWLKGINYPLDGMYCHERMTSLLDDKAHNNCPSGVFKFSNGERWLSGQQNTYRIPTTSHYEGWYRVYDYPALGDTNSELNQRMGMASYQGSIDEQAKLPGELKHKDKIPANCNSLLPLRYLYKDTGPYVNGDEKKYIIPYLDPQSDYYEQFLAPPHSWGTHGKIAMSKSVLQPVEFKDPVSGRMVHLQAFWEDGTFRGCPGVSDDSEIKKGAGVSGNTGLNTDYDDKTFCVGRTGFVLKTMDPNKKQLYSQTKHIKQNVLSTGSGFDCGEMKNIHNLSNETISGIQLKLYYYNHALSYGLPGKPGEYKSMFARAFAASTVKVTPGDGGKRTPINDASNTKANDGTETYIEYNCDAEGNNCKTKVVVSGGEGGLHGLYDDAEYAQLHQDQNFIKEFITNRKAKISSKGLVKGAAYPHCSMKAPSYTEEHAKKYTINGVKFIDDDCYGNDGVLGEESGFSRVSNLIDLPKVINNLDLRDIGKAGDGGFVRDECWIMPQYFAIKGLFLKSMGYDFPTTNGGGNVYGNISRGSLPDANNWGVVPNFTDSVIYTKYSDKTKNDVNGLGTPNALREENVGYTAILPQDIYMQQAAGAGTCRRQKSPFTGNKIFGNTHYSVEYTDPDGFKHKVTYVSKGDWSNDSNKSAFYATEIQGTEGKPGGVFVTW